MHDAPWSYGGDTGPEHWGKLSPDYDTCDVGVHQSPVDIANYVTADIDHLRFDYSHEPELVKNDGRLVELVFPGGDRLEFGEHSCQLVSAHYHCPSEHTIDGIQFAAELHLPHVESRGDLDIVGILYALGSPDPFLEALLAIAPSIGGLVTIDQSDSTNLNAANLLSDDLGYYTYMGSLTTPPCSEPVDWILMHQTRTVSADQVARLVALTGGGNTNRPIQPNKGIEIQYSGPRP